MYIHILQNSHQTSRSQMENSSSKVQSEILKRKVLYGINCLVITRFWYTIVRRLRSLKGASSSPFMILPDLARTRRPGKAKRVSSSVRQRSAARRCLISSCPTLRAYTHTPIHARNNVQLNWNYTWVVPAPLCIMCHRGLVLAQMADNSRTFCCVPLPNIACKAKTRGINFQHKRNSTGKRWRVDFI